MKTESGCFGKERFGDTGVNKEQWLREQENVVWKPIVLYLEQRVAYPSEYSSMYAGCHASVFNIMVCF